MARRERWRNVRRARGYQVSDRGRVRSVARTLTDGRACGGTLLAQWPDADGYLCVSIAGKPVRVHLLVLEAFHGPRPEGLEGCHGREGQGVNTEGNLRWDSRRENERDKKRKEGLEGIGRPRQLRVGTPETGELAVE